jgi:hypothetical protein
MRLCSKHNVQLEIKKLGNLEYLQCPVVGCDYKRALKNPHGDRSLNRKTNRKKMPERKCLKGEIMPNITHATKS